jgi:hypothetical protein
MAQALRNDKGKFKFDSIPNVSLLSFKSNENDYEIEDFLEKDITQECLENVEFYQEVEPHPRLAPFTKSLSPRFLIGCNKLFPKRLRSDIFSEDWGFGMKNYGKTYILTLKQKKEDVEIPLIHFEEKASLNKLEKDTRQFSKYAKNIFSQQISLGEKKLKFEKAYVLVLCETGKNVKLIQYQRPNQHQTLAECVKSSLDYDLFKTGTKNLNMNYVHDLFRVIFDCVFLQLKSLDLIH